MLLVELSFAKSAINKECARLVFQLITNYCQKCLVDNTIEEVKKECH